MHNFFSFSHFLNLSIGAQAAKAYFFTNIAGVYTLVVLVDRVSVA